MITKVVLKEKSLLEKIREIATSQRLFIKQKKGELTVIFNKTLTTTQKQKIKDLLGNRFHITIEEVENFPEG